MLVPVSTTGISASALTSQQQFNAIYIIIVPYQRVSSAQLRVLIFSLEPLEIKKEQNQIFSAGR
jgi:hypothetical protein